jgi:hypothetical protein
LETFFLEGPLFDVSYVPGHNVITVFARQKRSNHTLQAGSHLYYLPVSRSSYRTRHGGSPGNFKTSAHSKSHHPSLLPARTHAQHYTCGHSKALSNLDPQASEGSAGAEINAAL